MNIYFAHRRGAAAPKAGGWNTNGQAFNIAAYFETPFCESSLSMEDSRRNPKRRRRVPALRFSEASRNSLDMGAAGGIDSVQLHGKSKAALDPT